MAKMKIQKLATLPEGRPETGAMSFGDDWPGVFIRGDNAFHFAIYLRMASKRLKESDSASDAFMSGYLQSLAELLESCRVNHEA
jgi:hypothetical protein